MPRTRALLPFLLVTGALLASGLVAGPAAPALAAVADAPRCSSSGTWKPGEVSTYWFDVEQGDSQLVVGPTGRTLLVDLGEKAYNATGTSTKATAVAAQIRSICGIASGPVHLDYVLASHHHLDHIGYAGNPNDTTKYGNGIYQLLTPTTLGGLGFTVGQLIDRDGGTWVDANGDGNCDIGTSASPAPEADWNNAGTTSQTARRWICWLYGPAAQADRAHIDGKVVRLTNTSAWPALDLGTGVATTIVEANGKDVMQADGVTPVSGDHTAASTPPSENDYSVGVRLAYGPYAYATAGDSDGEYSTSANGYSYNDIEKLLASRFGTVNSARANHHGSGHSSSSTYVNALKPQTTFVSCGVNSYGHPANRVLDAFQAIGTDVYLANNPCDDVDSSGAPIDYSGTFNKNGTVRQQTSNAGKAFTVTFDAGSRSYTSRPSSGDARQVRVNEFLMAPSGTATEWVELHNPTSSSVAVGGYYIDDVAGGGGAPKQLPAGTSIPAGGRLVIDLGSGYLNNTGSETVRFLSISGGVERTIDAYSYSLSSTQYDRVFHRVGDSGSWCTTISASVTKGTANPATCP